MGKGTDGNGVEAELPVLGFGLLEAQRFEFRHAGGIEDSGGWPLEVSPKRAYRHCRGLRALFGRSRGHGVHHRLPQCEVQGEVVAVFTESVVGPRKGHVRLEPKEVRVSKVGSGSNQRTHTRY